MKYIFTNLEQEGIMLYDAGNVPLAERNPLCHQEAKAIAQQYNDQWFTSGVGFLKVAQYCLVTLRPTTSFWNKIF